MIGYAKYALIGLGALLFLFFMRRMLKRARTRHSRPAHVAARARDPAPAGRARGRRRPTKRQTDVKRLRSPVNVARRQVEDLVERDPDRVAQQVRAWMSED